MMPNLGRVVTKIAHCQAQTQIQAIQAQVLLFELFEHFSMRFVHT